MYYERALISKDEMNADEYRVLLVDRYGYDWKFWVNMSKRSVLKAGQVSFTNAKKAQCPPGFWGSDSGGFIDAQVRSLGRADQ